jgi:acyl-CoA reductase-like NAD-dependent aldehyde dehydrogenase
MLHLSMRLLLSRSSSSTTLSARSSEYRFPVGSHCSLNQLRTCSFTGSTRVGSIVASLCGKYIKPVVLELGGKAPAIVCEDADLELAANAIKFGGLFHSGQICMATQTAIVHESVVDKFLQLLTDKYPRASADPTDGAALRGLFTTVSANRVKEIVDDALSKGAKIVAGEHKVEGNVVQPVLLANVTEEMRAYCAV